MPGWDTPQSAGQSKSNSNSNTGRDTGSDYGQFDRAVSQAANNPPASQPSGGDGLIDPGFHPELAIADNLFKASAFCLSVGMSESKYAFKLAV